MQAELRLPDGSSKQVIVAGQPLVLNDEDCMLFSFVDMELRHKAEVALRQSEERFAKAFRLTPGADPDVQADEQQVMDVNQAFLDTLAYASEDVLGKTVDATGFHRRQRGADPAADGAGEKRPGWIGWTCGCAGRTPICSSARCPPIP